jgi:hypothetical protein
VISAREQLITAVVDTGGAAVCMCDHPARDHLHRDESATYCGWSSTCTCPWFEDGSLPVVDVGPLWRVVAALACFVSGAVLAAAYWWAVNR